MKKFLGIVIIVLNLIIMVSCSNNNNVEEQNTDILKDNDNNQNIELNDNEDDSINEVVEENKYRLGKKITWITNDFLKLSEKALDQFNIRLSDLGYDFYLEVISLDPIYFKDKLYEYISSGNQADIISCFMNSENNLLDYSTMFVINENYIPLDDYLFNEEGKELYSLTNEKIWKKTSYNNKTYVIPNKASSYIPYVYCINEEYVSNDYIFDEESFTALCNNLDIDKKGAFLVQQVGNLNSIAYFTELDYICPAIFADCKSLNIDSLYNQPNFIKFMIMLNNFYRKGFIKDDASLINDFSKNNNEDLDNKNYIVALTSSRNISEDIKMQKIPFYITSSFQGSIGISSLTSNADDAFKLLSLVYTNSELANLLIYGIEGEDFKLVDNSVVDKDAFFNEISFGLYDNVYPMSNDKDRVAKKQVQINEALPSPYLGFYFDSTGYEEIMKNVYDITYNNLNVWKDNDFENKIVSI